MSYLNGLPHCRWNPYVDCTHGKPKDVRIPDWVPHKKCFNCGWNPDVEQERKEKINGGPRKDNNYSG